jgi:hypothetical protein
MGGGKPRRRRANSGLRQAAGGGRASVREELHGAVACVCACDAVCVRAALCDVCVHGGLASLLGFTAVYFFYF